MTTAVTYSPFSALSFIKVGPGKEVQCAVYHVRPVKVSFDEIRFPADDRIESLSTFEAKKIATIELAAGDRNVETPQSAFQDLATLKASSHAVSPEWHRIDDLIGRTGFVVDKLSPDNRIAYFLDLAAKTYQTTAPRTMRRPQARRPVAAFIGSGHVDFGGSIEHGKITVRRECDYTGQTTLEGFVAQQFTSVVELTGNKVQIGDLQIRATFRYLIAYDIPPERNSLFSLLAFVPDADEFFILSSTMSMFPSHVPRVDHIHSGGLEIPAGGLVLRQEVAVEIISDGYAAERNVKSTLEKGNFRFSDDLTIEPVPSDFNPV